MRMIQIHLPTPQPPAAEGLHGGQANAVPADDVMCFGVCCARHARCARYLAVDGSSSERQTFLDHCGLEFSMFVPAAL